MPGYLAYVTILVFIVGSRVLWGMTSLDSLQTNAVRLCK